MKYKLGVLDKCAFEHGKMLAKEVGQVVDNPKLIHSVVVCVYYDGHLQFAGGDSVYCAKGNELNRYSVKNGAFRILHRMNPEGEVAKASDEETEK